MLALFTGIQWYKWYSIHGPSSSINYDIAPFCGVVWGVFFTCIDLKNDLHDVV